MEFDACAVTLHSDLKNTLLLLCQEIETEPVKKLEAAVQLCIRLLHELYTILPADGFGNGDEEIRFFKYIKPLFAAEREYYQRLYHGYMFGETNPGFWAHEKKRMEKLLAQHSDFVRYYHGGETLNDATWFSQGQAPLPTPLCMWQWETNPKHTSARDGWVAGVMAVERYLLWLNSKIDNIEKQ